MDAIRAELAAMAQQEADVRAAGLVAGTTPRGRRSSAASCRASSAFF